jgi:hypothetical protein
MGRLRRRDLIPEDEQIQAKITAAKLVMGNYGRQVELQPLVESGEYKGVQLRDWANFGKDEDGEEYVAYGSTLHSLLVLGDPELDEKLDDPELSDREYERILKNAVKNLVGTKILARVGVKAPKNAPDKKRNYLQAGTIGLYVEDEEEVEAPF